MLTIEPIKAFSDNYIWALRNDRASLCVIVDPGDPKPVEKYLKQNNLKLEAILVTHHHYDHTGGVQPLKQAYNCTVYGPSNSTIAGIDQQLGEGDAVDLKSLGAEYRVIEVPGHTLDHIAFIGDDHVFCGDTLFAAGCGRLFEGTPAQMWRSLQKLSHLPNNTKVYCAHEYTQANLKFAQAVEPDNQALQQRVESVKSLRSRQIPSVPSFLAEELTTNPFLRANQPTVKQAAETFNGRPLSTDEEVFAAIRQWKDQF